MGGKEITRKEFEELKVSNERLLGIVETLTDIVCKHAKSIKLNQNEKDRKA